MDDDWRLRVDLHDEAHAQELADRLNEYDKEHGLSTSFVDRVVVSRDGAEIFCYAATRDQTDAAEQAIRAIASERRWSVDTEVKHWHPTAEEWEDPDKPLPQTDAERAAERAELMDQERDESTKQGYPEYEVRVKCPSHRDARQLADKLREEGIPSVHRWEFVVLGAADEDDANALAERIRAEAPPGSTVTAEGSVTEATAEAPDSKYRKFAVFFGGLGG
jgi:hypothetical protein